jgi:hypothetical protein
MKLLTMKFSPAPCCYVPHRSKYSDHLFHPDLKPVFSFLCERSSSTLAQVELHTHTHTSMYVQAHVHIYTSMHVHSCAHTHAHTHKHACEGTCEFSCIHIHIHIIFRKREDTKLVLTGSKHSLTFNPLSVFSWMQV